MVDFLIFLYFFLGTVFFTYPLIFNLTTKISGLADELLITWIINWVIHALTTNPFFLFQANIFYPYKNTLAYSDIHLANALLALPFVKIFGEPVLAFNVNLLSGFIFTGFFTYLLVRYLTRNSLAGVLSGTLLTFSTIHLNYLGHLQLFCLQYFVLAIYFCFKFLEKRNFFNFSLFLLTSFLTTLNNFLVGYFLVFSVIIIWGVRGIRGIRGFLIWGFSLLLICAPFFLPYFKVSREFNYVRPIRDAVHFSLQPEDLIYPSNLTRLEDFLLSFFRLRITEIQMKVTPAYFGLTFFFLGIWAIFIVIRKIRIIRDKKRIIITFLAIFLLGLILAFGPVMHWGRKTIHQPFIVPLPYLAFYYLLPGFSGFRTPSRWILLAAFSLSVLIGIVFDDLTKKWKPIYRYWLTLFFIALIFLEFNFPLKFYSIKKRKDFPRVFSYLSYLNNDEPVLYLPILNWDSYELISLETRREFYSTLSFNPMVNGYSGFTPPEREILMKKIMAEFPSKELIKWLKEIKVKYVILQPEDYQTLEKNNFRINNKKIKNWSTIIKELKNFEKEISFKNNIDGDLIYEVN